MKFNLTNGWKVLQDVHDTAEQLEIFQEDFKDQTDLGNQLSEWEDIRELKHLQLLYAENPYFGRELRYFNQAPWWYRNTFALDEVCGVCRITFSNADYYCKVWLNGVCIGEHEGYSVPFTLDMTGAVRAGENVLTVKVSSPWDEVTDGNRNDRWTYMVQRTMVKGTYEHSDTFIQRDVNPVGLYGTVSIVNTNNAVFDTRPEITYELGENLREAAMQVKVCCLNAEGGTVRYRLTDLQTGITVCQAEALLDTLGQSTLCADVDNIHLWETWDKGGSWLYKSHVWIERDGVVTDEWMEDTGFRKIEMLRDEYTTTFLLNNKRFYVRGTSYFPNIYVSEMCRDQYKRDLLAIKAAGFNLVRVHVHVEQEIFYELCSQIGIALMQDSEYNWTHPADDVFAKRFISVYLDTVHLLKRHASMFLWICMNEPGLEDPMGRSSGRAMTVNPGPALYEAVRKLDPSRPAIKGSFCEDDLTSGDSHNYTGSLNGDDTHYTEIYGTTEKLNTEYGFDAPPCAESLKKCPKAYQRYGGGQGKLEEIQHYQYALLKYYTEHYRIQKYAPNSGYVQFLFSDLCPQSFYGLYDFWGLPKAGLDAMLESNMPQGIFLKYSRTETDGIFVVNDSLKPLGKATLNWMVTDENGKLLNEGRVEVDVTADCRIKAGDLHLSREEDKHVDVSLILTVDGQTICTNHYHDLFNIPEHVEGHPSRISHESGMRLYSY